MHCIVYACLQSMNMKEVCNVLNAGYLTSACSLPGRGRALESTSYAARVKPNCGDDRRILAGPPLKNALKPSWWKIVLAQFTNPVYVASPLRASTCSRVLITSAGVVK